MKIRKDAFACFESTGLTDVTENEALLTNGGIAPLIALFLAEVAVGVTAVVTEKVLSDWDNFKAGLSGKPEK